MHRLGRLFIQLIILLVVVGGGWVVVNQYSYIFSQTVSGETVAVERVMDPSTIIGSRVLDKQLYSFAVAVRDEKTGIIHSASSEDRQWAVVVKGQCVTAKFYPYPPWNFEKSGTYFNARLMQMFDCKSKVPTVTAPVPEIPNPAPNGAPAVSAPSSTGP